MRRGLTLFELLLALAVTILLLAITYPSLEGLYRQMRVGQAADQVRARLAEARGRAMNEGQPYRFAILPGHGNFRVAPDNPEFWSANGPPSLPADLLDLPLVVDEALPGSVRFHPGEGPPPIHADHAGDSALPAGSIEPGSWLTLATFLPDGTARDDALLWVYGPHANPMLLRLRGLTGTVSAETVYREHLTGVGR